MINNFVKNIKPKFIQKEIRINIFVYYLSLYPFL